MHEGLLSSQISAPDLLGTTASPAPKVEDISNAFTELTADEKDLISTIEEILGWTHDFFETEDDRCSDLDDRAHRTLCYRCVESCHTPFKLADSDEKLKSILLSVGFDTRATRDTLLNEAIREVHTEVDAWRDTQRQALISAITNTIISDDPSTETLAVSVAPLDPRLQSWIDTKKIGLRQYTRSRLTNQACEDTLDQEFKELLEERVYKHRRSLDEEVAARTAELQTAFDTELATHKAQLKKTLDADLDAARLDTHNYLTQETGRLRHEAKIKLQQLKDDLDSHALPSVIRTTKADKPTPLTSRPKKLRKKPARKLGALDFTPSPHASDDDMVTDNDSVTDTIHSPVASKADTPSSASRPTSTTPTQPAFASKADPMISVEPTATATPNVRVPEEPPVSAPTAAASIITPPPPAAPISEMTLLLQAFTGFKAEVTSAISDLNSKVTKLQSGVVPSSQPEEASGYYDDSYDENSNWRGADDPDVPHDNPDSHMTDLECIQDAEDAFANKLYRRLIDTDTIIPGTYHANSSTAPHDEFSLVFRDLCKSLSWSPTSYPTATQLPILAQTWSAHVREIDEQETLWAGRNLFGHLSNKHYTEHDAEFQRFFPKYLHFCKWAEHTPSRDLPESLWPSFKKYKAPPTPPTKQVRFTSQPPIDTLPLPPSQDSISPASLPDAHNIAFPPLGNASPITWATVTRRKHKNTTTPSVIAATHGPSTTSPTAPTTTPTNPTRPTRRPLPDALATSEYTIIIDPTSAPAFPDHIRHDPSPIVRGVQNNLISKAAEIKVLSGRWSTQEIRKNFIFKLEGKPDLDTIAKYNDILFRPFGHNCRAAPTEGYRQILLGWVPVLRDAENRPVSSSVLRSELMKSKVCAGRRIFSEPRWLGGPDRLAGKHHSSIVFSFYDPDGEGFELMKRSPPYLFGRETTVRAFESRPTLLQCARCLRLGHTSPNCKRSKLFIACAKCGGPHQTAIHKYHCNIRGAKHKGAHCDCPPSCFLCLVTPQRAYR
jgi:hypothetical protein